LNQREARQYRANDFQARESENYSMNFGKNSPPDIQLALSQNLASIWRFSLSLSGKPDVADDLTQSTCLRALEKQHQVDTNRPIIGWLLTICRSIW